MMVLIFFRFYELYRSGNVFFRGQLGLKPGFKGGSLERGGVDPFSIEP